MPSHNRPSHRFVKWAVAAACFLICSIAAPVGAEQDDARHHHRPGHGCAEAKIKAAGLRPPTAAPTDDAYREAMGDTDVLHYELDIEASDLSTVTHRCTLAGSNRMTIQSKVAGLTEFSFRLRNQYTITAALIDDTVSVDVTTTSTTTRVVDLTTLDPPIGLDDVFTLTIEYEGTTIADGPWDPIYVSAQPGAGAMLSTISCPYFSYTWWPVKDGDVYSANDHSDKSTIEFSMTVPTDVNDLVVPSNGSLQSVETLPDSRRRYHWATDYPIAPYLVCFAGAEYDTWSVSYDHAAGSMPVEFYIYPAWNNASNRQAWEEVVDMIEVYAELFGEYPFIDDKYGIYNAPFGGGMEHQTMTAQGGVGYAFNEYLTAHELSHMWWGDMITCETWNHVWLNEGFASYTEALWAEHKPGSSGLAALKSYMATMKYTGGGSVYVTEAEVGNVSSIFDGNTSYDKGAWVLHMLRHVLGDENFYDALATYRAGFEFGAATTEDFQAICEDFYPGGHLDWFFQEWIYGQRAPAYQWGWDAVEVGGQDYVLISIDQTQSSIYQRFAMPLDVVVDGETYVVFNDADPEHFVIPVASAPSSVSLDPDAWVLWSTRSFTGYTPGPPTVVATDPAPGATVNVSTAVDMVTVTFHTNVDAAGSDFSLVGEDTGPRSFTVTGTTSVNSILLELEEPLPHDTYTLTISDSVVATANGMALDGETTRPSDSGALPSGDGEPGGDCVIEFIVETNAIPTMSEWGIVFMALVTLIAGTVVHARTRFIRL